MKLSGRVHLYGANVDTDAIIPARYLNTSDPTELAKHCMEGTDPTFVGRVQPGDLVVATTNFGCGSSREHAPIAIKACGVSAVIAGSFARIFYRNAINIGLPILECLPAAQEAQPGDTMEADLATGEIVNVTQGRSYRAQPYPQFMLELVKAGGLVEYTKRRLAGRK